MYEMKFLPTEKQNDDLQHSNRFQVVETSFECLRNIKNLRIMGYSPTPFIDKDRTYLFFGIHDDVVVPCLMNMTAILYILTNMPNKLRSEVQETTIDFSCIKTATNLCRTKVFCNKLLFKNRYQIIADYKFVEDDWQFSTRVFIKILTLYLAEEKETGESDNEIYFMDKRTLTFLMSKFNRCGLCFAECSMRCAKCYQKYCSKEHQMSHWKHHKKICGKWFSKIRCLHFNFK